MNNTPRTARPTACLAVLTLLLLSFFAGKKGFCAAPAEVQQWLEAHNSYRSSHDAPPLTWSDTVAASAQAWADTCPSGHSGSGYGENIAWASYVMAPDQVVTLWYDEEPLYDYSNPGWTPAAGHFTQVVWKNTTQIGCGMTTGCGGQYGNVWVCQYNPYGNVMGQFAENVFPKTSPPAPELSASTTPGLTTKSIPPILKQLILK